MGAGWATRGCVSREDAWCNAVEVVGVDAAAVSVSMAVALLLVPASSPRHGTGVEEGRPPRVVATGMTLMAFGSVWRSLGVTEAAEGAGLSCLW